jgi:hypothetical protein
MRVGEIQTEPTVLLGDAQIDRSPGRIELGLGFERTKPNFPIEEKIE